MKYKKRTNAEKYRPKVDVEYGERLSGRELHGKISQYRGDMKRRCLFLYNLMGNKMHFIENPTELEIKHLKDIKESLDDVFICALCDAEIPQDEMICDDCWKKEKKDWSKK